MIILKPQHYFYSYPTGGPKYVVEPSRDGTYTLTCDSEELGCFATAAEAALGAGAHFQREIPNMVEAARKMRDLDWWERSPVSKPWS